MVRIGSLCALAGWVLLACPPVAYGSTFFSPDSVTASRSDNPKPGGGVFGPDPLIDRSGLTPSGSVTLHNIGSMNHIDMVMHSDAMSGELWRARTDLPPGFPVTLTFEFVNPQDLMYVGMWQGYSQREGVGNFELRFFDMPNAMGTQIGGVYTNFLDDPNLVVADPSADDNLSLAGRAFNVGLRSGVRSMRMDIKDVAVPFGPFVHLGEVMVAVPEPSTYLSMFGLSLCGVYFWRRRRR